MLLGTPYPALFKANLRWPMFLESWFKPQWLQCLSGQEAVFLSWTSSEHREVEGCLCLSSLLPWGPFFTTAVSSKPRGVVLFFSCSYQYLVLEQDLKQIHTEM